VTLSILVARSMARPLREAVAVLHGVGVGDLSQRLTPHTRDEVGEMALSLNKTLDILKDSFATMQYRATHDSLTGLANRASFHAQAAEMLDESAADCAAVLLIDLDGFKSVNDFFGHAVGDALLVEIARRLREHVRPADLAARLGGDEFAVLLVQLDNPQHAQEVAERLQHAIQTPVTINDIRLLPAASIGIAHWHSRESVDKLLHEADIEMYAAKAASRTHFGTLTGPAPQAGQK
jgi:diguanylate cyclase (GGDEF)-like protein